MCSKGWQARPCHAQPPRRSCCDAAPATHLPVRGLRLLIDTHALGVVARGLHGRASKAHACVA